MRRPLALAWLSLLFVWGAQSGCVTVLDLDGYVDAASALCACPGFEKVDSCAAMGQSRLSAASEQEREAWLASYDAKQCGTACEHAASCYGALPGCDGKKPGCECCVWNEAVIECVASSTCQPCRSCSEIVTVMDDGTKLPGVEARGLLAELQKCACTVCANDCTGFCQGYELLQGAPDTCSSCLSKTCKPMLDACLADKP